MESKKCANCGTELTGKELVCWGCGFNLQNPQDPENQTLGSTKIEADKAFWDSIDDMVRGLLYLFPY